MDILEGFTIILAVATFWLAWTTKEMAFATKQMLALESQPFVSLKAIQFGAGTPPIENGQVPHINVSFLLENPGKVLTRYRIANLEISLNNSQPALPETFINRGGVIHPASTTSYMYPSILIPPDSPSPLNGKIVLDIRYWSIPSEEHSMKATIDVTIHTIPKFEYLWIYTSGPLFS